ncbi:uncharacterized protein PHALS_03552 [Plasmopara halstedii]|uniref:Uncharacterized protein n=1 Tax=Plasmopara halstedii TaxID=4781 RepID=A0A0P1AZ18_PLAHL|nr:uncharacterized protein PHALS_03552 [Plasmopara halstedii]CEG46878.1 hypothetical protein PHALS_03552 [Plasmopara halstedii]|eukprot:XP_024583247.1 hypothetical protein PHALS_03552 [Plasmopara halstedii]
MSLQNERKWRNVQVILPESFGLVVHVLSQQARLIEKLEHRLCSMESNHLEAVMSAQIAAMEERMCADVRRQIASIQSEFSGHLEQQQLLIQQIKDCSKIETQKQREQVDRVEQSVEQRYFCLEKQLTQFIESTQQHLETQNVQFKSIRTLHEETLTKISKVFVQKVENLEDELLKREISSEATSIIATEELVTLKSYEQDLDNIHQNLARTSQETEARFVELLATHRKELMTVMEDKVCKSEVAKLLNRKMDAMDAWKQLAEKADCIKVEEVACSLMDSIQRYQETATEELDRLKQLNKSKADAFELVQVRHNLHNILSVAESMQHELTTLHRQMNEKMTVVDVKELLNSQVTINGLQKPMKEVESVTVDNFATKVAYDDLYQQVHAITMQLRSEMYQARYIWKDGRLSLKHRIQWSSQAVNTNEDVFHWQSGSDEIRLHPPGLYHLQASFFTVCSPLIQVLVNGEPAIIRHSTADLKNMAMFHPCAFQRLHHPAGNIAGLSVDVFLALPPRALVAISYDAEEQAQGFLNLRKL